MGIVICLLILAIVFINAYDTKQMRELRKDYEKMQSQEAIQRNLVDIIENELEAFNITNGNPYMTIRNIKEAIENLQTIK